MEEKAAFSSTQHKPIITVIDMLLSQIENKENKSSRSFKASAPGQTEPQVSSGGGLKNFGINRLVCGGVIFIGLTIAIFWYQFAEIPNGHRAGLWNQLQWDYLFWLLLFLPVDTFAAGLRIWVICRVLQPGVSFWTCLKAEWANLGLAMLTPSQTGGGFGQIYVLNRGGLNIGTALTVSLITFFGSMVGLLFIGIYSLLISRVEHLTVFFQGALLAFFLVFGVMIVAVCWPGSLRWAASGISKAVGKIGDPSHTPDRMDPRSGFKTSDQVQGQGAGRSRKRSIHGYVSIYRRSATQPLGLRWDFETTSKQNSRIKRLAKLLHNGSESLIDLCYMHQVNIRRFFNLKKSSFIWVCLLSLAFMLSRSIMAFLCLRFLGIPASNLYDIVETQLSLIFLIYFAPTPGSSGLAEGASMLMMDGAMPGGLVPYYNLLWRCSTLYLPAIAGLLFLSWTIVQDARRVVGR